MRIAVLGGGSIGLHLASQLFIAGHQITIICRSEEQVHEIREKGVRYVGLDGSIQEIFIHARSMDEGPGEMDWIFLTVKQTQILSIIPFLKKVDSKTPVLCFQNGLGHEERLKTYLPTLSLYYAVTTEGAYRKGPREVQHTGKGLTFIGVVKEDQTLIGVMTDLVDSLGNSSFSIQVERDMKARIWKKLIINACINPLTALFQVTNGKLLESEYVRKMMSELLEEASCVARKEGVVIHSGFMQDIVQVCRNTYHNRSSMLQDLEAGRETEIQYINGAITRTANHHGVSVRTHALLVNLILAKQQLQ